MPLASFGGNETFTALLKAKTAAYTVLVSESGVIFTNRGATASVTFTLPAVTNLPIGFNVTFYGLSAYGFAVASGGSADNIVVQNDATADSITFTTTSRIIGAACKVVWDGTAWLSFIYVGATAAYA